MINKHGTVTGRWPSKPAIQNIPIRTEEGHKMKETLQHVAWTGGSSPRPVMELSEAEWEYAKKLYVDDLDTWRSFWQEDTVPVDIRNIFWGRARHDAHATFRARKNSY